MSAWRKKACSKCGAEKVISGFYRRSDSTDGHQSQCKACVTARNLANYYANRQAFLAVQFDRRRTAEFRERDRIWRRKYVMTEKGKALKLESRRTWTLLHPEHQRRIELNRQARRRRERAEAMTCASSQ